MQVFIRTQLLGIRKSKRLMGTLLFAPLLLLFCSYNASNSWIPAEYLMALFAGLISMLSGEILHWLTVDEIKDGIFDIILISPVSRLRILFGKLFVPVVSVVLFSFGSLMANNFLAQFYRYTLWKFSIGTSALLIFGALFAALLEFVVLLIMRKNNINIHFLLLAGGLMAMLGAFYLWSNGLFLSFFLALLLCPAFLAGFSLILLEKRHQFSLKKSNYALTRLFGENRISIYGAFFRKNLSETRLHSHAILQTIIALVAPILAGFAAHYQKYFPAELVVSVALSAIPAVVNIYLVYYSSLRENRSKLDEVFQAMKISAFYRVCEKSISAGIVSTILCLIAFPVINTTCRLSCGLMIATICNNFVSAFVWGVCFSKVQSFKGENGCKVLISVISIALQTLNILL